MTCPEKHSANQVVQIQCTMKENVMDIVNMFREMIFHVLTITFTTNKQFFWSYEMTTFYKVDFFFFTKNI